MNEYLLSLIPDMPPPRHTHIKPRCFTCKKFPVCCLREDYLKTVKLMENVLGNPCQSFELKKKDKIVIEVEKEELKS